MSSVLDNKDLLILKNISHIYNQESLKIKVLNNYDTVLYLNAYKNLFFWEITSRLVILCYI